MGEDSRGEMDALVSRLESAANERGLKPFAARVPVKPENASLVEWGMWLLLFLVPEFVAVFSNHAADTLSYSVRFAMGRTYGWRWVLLGGIVTGVCLWLPAHFLYYLGPKWLPILTGVALVACLLLAVFKP